MKKQLDAACLKCGSQVWYVYAKSRRCVECSNKRAEGYVSINRETLTRLKAEIDELKALLSAARRSDNEKKISPNK